MLPLVAVMTTFEVPVAPVPPPLLVELLPLEQPALTTNSVKAAVARTAAERHLGRLSLREIKAAPSPQRTSRIAIPEGPMSPA